MWIDPWIKDIPTFKPTTLVINGLEDLRVSVLCFNGLPSWNTGLLRALFNEHDVKAISKMLLPFGNMDDKIIWNFTNDLCGSLAKLWQVMPSKIKIKIFI